jgi:hypothetical protein
LPRTAVIDAVHYGFIDIDIAVPDFDIVATLRIGADPSFIHDRSSLAAEI